ncbi:MAG TPA: Xaa-Pro peptidase family protein [Candidatus Methanoperedens sp.]|nr:Xaa-Pro peptidase family protein [Candidatus Methanoperedens sp.]
MTGGALHAGRVARLRSALGRRGPPGVLVTHLPNVRWLCGFTGSAGLLLVLPREAVFFTDFRYRVQSAREVRGAARVEYTGGALEPIAPRVRRARIGRLGFEADRMTVSTHAELKAALPGVELVPLRQTVEALRAVKDRGEVAAIRQALSIAGRALAPISRGLLGRTELDVAERLRVAIRREGGEQESFPTIVASGPEAAQPHAIPTSRRISGGDLVVIDYGVRIDGYCSDVTRTYSPGKWEARSKEMYQVVLAAQRAAIAAIRPGARGSDVDAAARGVIERAGHGKCFGHGTGHGVGLEVHEKPVLSPKSGDILAPGMVMTVEPGIYVRNYGGVRIEDMLLVTRDGAEVLSRAVPKPLDH